VKLVPRDTDAREAYLQGFVAGLTRGVELLSRAHVSKAARTEVDRVARTLEAIARTTTKLKEGTPPE
jgi:hypothetical protein